MFAAQYKVDLYVFYYYTVNTVSIYSVPNHTTHTQTVSPTTKRDLKDRASRGVTKHKLRLWRTLTMTLTWRRNLTIIAIKGSRYFTTYVSTTQTTGNSQHKISAWWRNDLVFVSGLSGTTPVNFLHTHTHTHTHTYIYIYIYIYTHIHTYIHTRTTDSMIQPR